MNKNSGFTLIELLVVTSLTVMLMLTASSVFVTYMMASQKATTMQSIKNEGGLALNQMEFLLRNSLKIIQNSDGDICQMGMQKIALISYDGGITELMVESDTNDNNIVKIASNSGIYMTSGKNDLVTAADSLNYNYDPVDKLHFDCVESPDGKTKHITVSFILRRGNLLDKARDIAVQEFTTGVTLRN